MFACIYIPDFPVQASLLPEPTETRAALSLSPVAILDGPANLPRVFALNAAARRAGIQISMTKLQAEICAGMVLRKRSLAEEEAAQTLLLECAAQFSPRVESTKPGAAILDMAGTEKLFRNKKKDSQNGGPQNVRQPESWRNVVRVIATKTAEAGFNANIAIAANPDTAFLAASGFPTNTIIPAGEEAHRLTPLSTETLPISLEMRETLASWGIRTFQALAALPAVALVERLGQEGLHLQKLAQGAVTRPLLTFDSGAEFTASFEFDDPVETLESIFFILNRLLHELCQRLLNTAQAASELRLTVALNVRHLAALCGSEERERQQAAPSRSRAKARLGPERSRGAATAILSEPSGESKDIAEHVWKLPVPTQDKNLLFSLIRLYLEKSTFSAPVRCLCLEVIPVKPRLAQGNLFMPPAPEPERMELTLERIRGVIGNADPEGTACVGLPHLLDTHKPDSFTLQHFSSIHDLHCSVEPSAPLKANFCRTPHHNSNSAVVFRPFRPALETTVELDGQKPHFICLWNRQRRVLAASGPWSTSGNWWNASAWTREEWDVAIQTPAGVGFYRIYRDRLRRQWFVEGVFD